MDFTVRNEAVEQRRLRYLAILVAGEFVDDEDSLRGFDTAESFSPEVKNRLGIKDGPASYFDHGDDEFAPCLVRETEYRRLPNLWKFGEDILDLSGVHVEPARDDDVLLHDR